MGDCNLYPKHFWKFSNVCMTRSLKSFFDVLRFRSVVINQFLKMVENIFDI